MKKIFILTIVITFFTIIATSCKNEPADLQINKFATLVSVTGKASEYSTQMKNYSKEQQELLESLDALASLGAEQGIKGGTEYNNMKNSSLTFTFNFDNFFNKGIEYIFVQLFTTNDNNEKKIISSYEIRKSQETNFDGTESFTVQQSSGELHDLIENSLIDYTYDKDKRTEIMSNLIKAEITKIAFSDNTSIQRKSEE